mgnify:CR=1 FL=1
MNENTQENDATLDTKVYKERKRWLFFGLPFTFTKYTLTTKSLQMNKGLLTSTQDDLLLFRVMDVSIKRTLFQKMAGLGTLLIRSSDKTNPVLEIRNIKHCVVFKTALDERVENERLRMRFRSGELMGDFDQDMDADGN